MTESRWRLETQAGCQLVIAGYPPFSYDARGGGGLSSALPDPDASSNTLPLEFPAQDLMIPPMDSSRARFLGLPLPPGLSIQIQPDRLAGELKPHTGELTLEFRARFRFTLGSADHPLYQASDLLVNTQLTSGEVRSRRHTRVGQPLNPDGLATLVGTATIEPCRDAWLTRFLGLPDEALAVMHLRLQRI